MLIVSNFTEIVNLFLSAPSAVPFSKGSDGYPEKFSPKQVTKKEPVKKKTLPKESFRLYCCTIKSIRMFCFIFCPVGILRSRIRR